MVDIVEQVLKVRRNKLRLNELDYINIFLLLIRINSL